MSKVKSIICRLAKTGAFAAALLCAVLLVSSLLSRPIAAYWGAQTGLRLVHSKKNYYDVLFLGTSTVIANISNQELYEKYGVAGVSLGEPVQPAYLSRYTLEDALTSQSPKAVVFDSKALFYTDEDSISSSMGDTIYILHNALDSIRSYKVRLRALDEIEEKYNPDIDRWEFLSKLYAYHNNWKELTERYFALDDDAYDYMNGNVAVFTFGEKAQNVYDGSEEELVEISEGVEAAFAGMVGLCKERDIAFVLITGYPTFTRGQTRTLEQLAGKYQVPYLDINEHIDEIGFDFRTDLTEDEPYVHLNVSGARKWTDYLGAYLTEHYDFSDRREDSHYAAYHAQEPVYRDQQECMQDMIALTGADGFLQYLLRLEPMIRENENIVALLSMKPGRGKSISPAGISLLNKLGIDVELETLQEEGLTAILSRDHVYYETGGVTGHEETIRDITFMVCNQDQDGNVNIGTCVNGINQAQNGPGLNIAVYHIPCEKVISSVFFNLAKESDPQAGRMVRSDTTTYTKQFRTGFNVWENKE